MLRMKRWKPHRKRIPRDLHDWCIRSRCFGVDFSRDKLHVIFRLVTLAKYLMWWNSSDPIDVDDSMDSDSVDLDSDLDLDSDNENMDTEFAVLDEEEIESMPSPQPSLHQNSSQ